MQRPKLPCQVEDGRARTTTHQDVVRNWEPVPRVWQQKGCRVRLFGRTQEAVAVPTSAKNEIFHTNFPLRPHYRRARFPLRRSTSKVHARQPFANSGGDVQWAPATLCDDRAIWPDASGKSGPRQLLTGEVGGANSVRIGTASNPAELGSESAGPERFSAAARHPAQARRG